MITTTEKQAASKKEKARPMKRHEACFHVNELIERERNSIEYARNEIARIESGESDKKDDMLQYYRDRIAESELRLQALDMAGDALTK